MTASERRNAIIEVLCLRRFDTVENLAFSDIFEDATKIAVVGVATEKVNDVFGW